MAETPKSHEAIIAEFKAQLDGLDTEQLGDLASRLLATGRDEVDPFERPAPPSQRRPRRDDVVTYRVRVDLKGTKPPLWRRLELTSNLTLDKLHDVLQAAFGWTDSHLHRFAKGPDYYDATTEYYLCPFEVDEGETGIPEQDVQIDEVLADQGDRLFYLYDFGDDWEHVIKLEKVLPRDESTPYARCTDGKRPGPSEDCGGVHGYELFAAANDPAHADHTAARQELARIYGDDIDPGYHAPTPFDPDDINDTLAALTVAHQGRNAQVPEPVAAMIDEIRDMMVRLRVEHVIIDAKLDQPVEIDAERAAHIVRAYQWLIERVGDDGIKLTAAGYLPPADVKAAMTELDWEDQWIGKHNREDTTLPVLNLRESAQALGLIRKYKGRLQLTRASKAVRGDPSKVFWHIAKTLPFTSKNEAEQQCGIAFLLAMAADQHAHTPQFAAEVLDGLGWLRSDRQPLTGPDACDLIRRTLDALTALHPFRPSTRHEPGPLDLADQAAFARAALTTW